MEANTIHRLDKETVKHEELVLVARKLEAVVEVIDQDKEQEWTDLVAQMSIGHQILSELKMDFSRLVRSSKI